MKQKDHTREKEKEPFQQQQQQQQQKGFKMSMSSSTAPSTATTDSRSRTTSNDPTSTGTSTITMKRKERLSHVRTTFSSDTAVVVVDHHHHEEEEGNSKHYDDESQHPPNRERNDPTTLRPSTSQQQQQQQQHPAAAEVVSVPKQKKNMFFSFQHLSKSCPPGLSGSGPTAPTIEPVTLGQLLLFQSISLTSTTKSSTSQLIIPIFQRKYCWNIINQGRQWWNDVILESKCTGVDGKHTIGKIVTSSSSSSSTSSWRSSSTTRATTTMETKMNKKDQDDSNNNNNNNNNQCLYIIDGQQRITTTLLLLAALRDGLLSILLQLVVVPKRSSASSASSSSTSTSTNTTTSTVKENDPDMVVLMVQETIDDIHRYLYADATEASIWAQDMATVAAAKAQQQQQQQQRVQGDNNTNNNESPSSNFIPQQEDEVLVNILPRGIIFPFERLIPSFDDRVPFLETTMNGLVQYYYDKNYRKDRNHHQYSPHDDKLSLSSAASVSSSSPNSNTTKTKPQTTTSTFGWSQHTIDSNMGAMKVFFDTQVQELIEKESTKTKTTSLSSSSDATSTASAKEDDKVDIVVLGEKEEVVKEDSINTIIPIVALQRIQYVTHQLLNDCYLIQIHLQNSHQTNENHKNKDQNNTTIVNLPQIFLWLQEKSLLGLRSLLYNAAPGIYFSAGDLVRNLLMAPIILGTTTTTTTTTTVSSISTTSETESETERNYHHHHHPMMMMCSSSSQQQQQQQQQEEILYRTYWLDAIEDPAGGTPKAVESMLTQFLDAQGDQTTPIPLITLFKEKKNDDDDDDDDKDENKEQQKELTTKEEDDEEEEDYSNRFVPPSLIAGQKASQAQETIIANSKRHVSSLEQQLLCHAAYAQASGAPSISSGLFIYGRFVSYFESVAMTTIGTPMVNDNGDDDDDVKTSIRDATIWKILDEMAKFCQNMVR